MPPEKLSDHLRMRREIIARCELALLEAAADVDPSCQTEKAAHDLRRWLKVMKQQTDDLEKHAAKKP